MVSAEFRQSVFTRFVWPRRAAVPSRADTAGKVLVQGVAELFSERHVYEEVSGGAENLKYGAELDDEEGHGGTSLWTVLEKDLDDSGRRVADHEDENYDDHDEGDVLFLVVFPAVHSHRRPLFSDRPVGDRQAGVEAE